MRQTFSNDLKFAAVASVALSLGRVALAFAAPSLNVEPLGVANWCLFIVASYFALVPHLPRLRSSSTIDHLDRMAGVKVWAVVFLAFAFASWAEQLVSAK